MLIQSSLPGSIEASFSLVYQHGTADWMTVAETWQKVPRCEKNSRNACGKLVPDMEAKRNINNSCSLNHSAGCSQQSSVRTMDENSTPAFVYRRRKPKMSSVLVSPPRNTARLSDDCLSAISSEVPSMIAQEAHMGSIVDLESHIVGAPMVTPVQCSKEAFDMKSESIDGHLLGEEPGSCCVNDSYSSSKSNVELGSTSLRTEVDENGECSSSSALVVEGLQDDMSEREICISILRSQWLLEGIWPIKAQISNEGPSRTTSSSCMRRCKICEHQETTLKMLICDQCEEAFHVSCCYPRIKKTLVDEWFCYSCLKKKHKILKEITTSKMPHNNREMSRSEDAIYEDQSGPIAATLIDTGPYTSDVRIGQDFQADVPDWAGPSFDNFDAEDQPTEIDPLESISLHDCNRSKLSRISSIGNWVQCRQVIEGIGDNVDGTICGKWRRAPLFEVQTDNWECFCAVLWDPAHADCAVPQIVVAEDIYQTTSPSPPLDNPKELDTDQVLKQLKYIELLRPRLTAKRCRLDQAKEVGFRDNAEDVTNVRTP